MGLPIMLQNVISLGVNLADNLMLGGYMESSLSGATAVNQIQFFYQCVLAGIGDGMLIISAQYWGKKDTASIKKLAAIAMRFALIFMLILFAVVSLAPAWVLRLFTTDPDIISEGVSYLGIVRFTYPFFCLTTILLAVLRSTEVVRIALYLSVSALCINCGINWVLIYGRLGLPRLGVTGAAIGTLTARIAEFIILLIYLKKREKSLHLRLSDFFRIDKTLQKDYLHVSLPIIFISGLWGVNTAIQTAILGHLSSAAIAANSMASNLYQIVKTAAIGASQSANVQIGKYIGEGDEQKVYACSRTLQVIFVIMGLLCGILLFALTEPVLSLYSFSDESRSLARTFLHILCFIMIGMSYQMPTGNGIIKGGGDTKFIMKMDLISIWCIVIPLSFFVTFVLNASPAVVVWCLNLDQLFKCLPVFIKVNHGNWLHKLTR